MIGKRHKSKAKVARKARDIDVTGDDDDDELDDEEEEEEEVEEDEDDDESNYSDEDLPPSNVLKYVEKLSQGLGLVQANSKPAKKRKSQKKESESSSEEERWLDAIQSGKLEEVRKRDRICKRGPPVF